MQRGHEGGGGASGVGGWRAWCRAALMTLARNGKDEGVKRG